MFVGYLPPSARTMRLSGSLPECVETMEDVTRSSGGISAAHVKKVTREHDVMTVGHEGTRWEIKPWQVI